MAFDETRDYCGDWQYIGRMFDVSWERPGEDGETEITTGLKARFDTISNDLISVAASLGIASQVAAIVVWEPKASDVEVEDWEPIFVPRSGHFLRKETAPQQSGEIGEGWLIADARESATRGKWVCLCQREVTNA
jgi:hypothetical protein